MLEKRVNNQDIDINFYDSYPNQELLSQKLEHWFTRYSPDIASWQMALYESQLKSLVAQRSFFALIKPLKSIYDFSRPLLNDQMREQFGLTVDCGHIRLLEGYDLQKDVDIDEQPIILAALRNYPADKTFPRSAHLSYSVWPYPPSVGWVTSKLEDVCGAEISCSTGLIDADVNAFVRMCRSLDLGGQYQTHLDSVFNDESLKPQIESAFILKERCRFEVLSHIARMSNDVSQEAYEVLLEVAKADGKPVWRGGPVRFGELSLFNVKNDRGIRLEGMFTIMSHSARTVPENADGPLIVYLPGEPGHPLREFASVSAFFDYLRMKLDEADYRRYFERFIGLKHRIEFLRRLDSAIRPDGNLDPGASLSPYWQSSTDLPFKALYTQACAKLRSDSRVLAVPTPSKSTGSGFEPIQLVKDIAHFAFDMADVFLPASEVRDLVKDVFIAAEDWLEGDKEKALEQLYELGKDFVLAAAPQTFKEYERLERIYKDGKAAVQTLLDALKAAGDSVSGASPDDPGVEGDELNDLQLSGSQPVRNMIKPSAFVEGLAQVKLNNGKTHLWKPDLAGFDQPGGIPKGGLLNGRSLYEAGGKTWLSMGGCVYQIGFDSIANKWCVLPSERKQKYLPLLEENGAGAWRFEGEDPMGWDAYKAFRRLHGDCERLSNAAIDHILRITEADEGLLRQIHVDKLVPPALLIDCTERFLIDEEVTAFIRYMGRLGDVEAHVMPDPSIAPLIEPYLDFIVTLPGWPEQRVLRRLDAHGNVLSRYPAGAHGRNVDVVYTQGDIKGLLETLLAGLLPVEIEALLVNFQPPRSPVQHFAWRIASEASGRRKALFDRLYAVKYLSTAPLIKLLQRDFPSLPYVVAREILSVANSTEKSRMHATQRIPLRVAESAREYLQQLRINRALECFYLHMESPDSDLISLDLISSMPDWPKKLIIEVRKDSFNGEMVFRSGGKATAPVDVNLVLVQKGGNYQTYNNLGQRTWFDSPRLRTTMANVLSSQSQLVRHEHSLENILGDMATLQRSRVKRALGIHGSKPGIKWPSRSQDGRLGYRLSGRMRGLFDKFKGNTPAFSPELAVKRLYPQFTSLEIKAFLESLAATFEGSAEEKRELIRARLNELGQDYEILESALDSWVAEARLAQPEQLAGASADGREIARMRILSCWRREHESRLEPDSEDSVHKLDLDNLAIGALPDIAANFEHVHALTMENIGLTTEAAERFLSRFEQLRSLSLCRNRIESVPRVVGSLSFLKKLMLSQNPIRVDDRGMQHLRRLTALEKLYLEGQDVNIAVTINVRHWLSLIELRLRNCGLTSVPGGLGISAALRFVDLRHNQIADIDRDTLSAIFLRNTLYVRLQHNPLSADTVARAESIFSPVELWNMGIVMPVQPIASEVAIGQWLNETGTEQQRQHWADLLQEANAEAFVLMVSDLLRTQDYETNRGVLSGRLWRMIEAISASETLRDELFRLAAQPETCGDGTMITFNGMDIRVLVHELESLPGGKTPVDMFKLMRGLERLDELERIALEDISARLAKNQRVDQAEVRLVYPTKLQGELNLPGQAQDMLFAQLAGVDESTLYNAKVRVLNRESTPAFFESLVARKDWLTFLEDHFQDAFETVKTHFHDRLEALDLEAGSMTSDLYKTSVDALFQAQQAAVRSKALQLTQDIALLAS